MANQGPQYERRTVEVTSVNVVDRLWRREVTSHRSFVGRRRRIHVNYPLPKPMVINIFHKLRLREITSRPHPALSLINSSHRFRYISLKDEYDTYGPLVDLSVLVLEQRFRSRVDGLVACKDIICALTESGVCVAFRTGFSKPICFLNQPPYMKILKMFYNKFDDSLITYAPGIDDDTLDPQNYLCNRTRIRDIRSKCPENGIAIFENESLRISDQLVFENVHGHLIALFFDSSIAIFELKNYTVLRHIESHNEIEQVRISNESQLVLFYQRQGSSVDVQIYSLEGLRFIVELDNLLLPKEQDLEYIQLFNEKLLLKQEGENLLIFDLTNSELREVSKMKFITPCADAILHTSQLLLTFQEWTAQVWNSRVEPAVWFEDHLLRHPGSHKELNYITSDENLIISKCKSTSFGSPAEVGSINISNVRTGKSLWKIQPSTTTKRDSHMVSCKSTVEEALLRITALHYDEDRNTIYTGNSRGLVHVWSP